MATECVFCHEGPGSEGENKGLYRYNYAMVQMKMEPGWAHHACMKQAVDEFKASGQPAQPATNEVIRDNNRAGKTGRVLPVRQPDPANDAPPDAAPRAVKAKAAPKPKAGKASPKPAKAADANDPCAGKTTDQLLAIALKLGYVEQPAPNGGVRAMRIKNFIRNHPSNKGKAA
jgi:hypothetical protein